MINLWPSLPSVREMGNRLRRSQETQQGALKHSVQKIDWGQLSLGIKVEKGIFRKYIPSKM